MPEEIPPEQAGPVNTGEENKEEEREAGEIGKSFIFGVAAGVEIAGRNHPRYRREKLFERWQREFVEEVRTSDPRFNVQKGKDEGIFTYRKRKKQAERDFAQVEGKLRGLASDLVESNRDALFAGENLRAETQISEFLERNPEFAKTELGATIIRAQEKTSLALEDHHQKIMNMKWMRRHLHEVKAQEDSQLIFKNYRFNLSQREDKKQQSSKNLLKHQNTIEKIIRRHLEARDTENLMQKVWTEYHAERSKPTLLQKIRGQKGNVTAEEQREFAILQNEYYKNRLLTDRVNREYRQADAELPQYLNPPQVERPRVSFSQVRQLTNLLKESGGVSEAISSVGNSLLSGFSNVFGKLGGLFGRGGGAAGAAGGAAAGAGAAGAGVAAAGGAAAGAGAGAGGAAAGAGAAAGGAAVAGGAAAGTVVAPFAIAIAVVVIVIILLAVFFQVGKASSVTEPAALQTTEETTTPTLPPGDDGGDNPPYKTPGKSLEEVMTIAASETCTPLAMVKAISRREAGGTWNYTEAQFGFYNTYRWWQSAEINETNSTDKSKVCSGYGYNTCTNEIAADSKFAGQYCGSGPRSGLCVSGAEVMGPMQFEKNTFNGRKSRVEEVLKKLGIDREADRRVILDAFLAAGIKLKADSGATSCTAWNPQEIENAARSYYGKCTYSIGSGGNYCREVCDYYNLYSDTDVDCSRVGGTGGR